MAPPALFVSILTVIITASPAFAARGSQCVQFDDPAVLFGHSDFVFVGIALAVKPTGVEGQHVMSHQATFRVERIWKGAPERQRTVDADEAFEPGKRYIVFAGGTPSSTSLLCKWSELEAVATKKREWLRSRPSQRPD